MTSLTSVLISFLLEREPEVDLSVFMLSWVAGERNRPSEPGQEDQPVKDMLLSWKGDFSLDGTSQRSQRQWISGCFV